MFKQLRVILAGICLAFSSMLSNAEVLPPEYFALRSVISDVQLSPDGKYLALLKIANRDANPVIEVYQTDDLEAQPYRVNADPMEIQSFSWVTSKDIVLTLRQQVRDDINGFNQGVFEYSIARLDVERERIKELREPGASIVSLLPGKPDSVLLSFYPEDSGSRTTGSVAGGYRAQSFYEYNLRRGSKRLIMRGNDAMGSFRFTGDGRPWYALSRDGINAETLYMSRVDDEWIEVHRVSDDSHESFRVVGFDEAAPHLWFVVAENGEDKASLWEYNTETKRFGEKIYGRNDVDIGGVRYHSNRWNNPDTITGIRFYKDKFHFVYFDGEEEALYSQLQQLVPDAGLVSIASRSSDGATLIVRNTSPRDPGTYYLIRNGRLSTVGEQQPLLKSENLADVRYIQYESRDGRTIPAFITVPNGEGPFPLVVMPHGGPFVGETVVFDRWAQLLANSGYMVLQPQYRGSMNYGMDHYMSAFINGGKGGYEMQDDKDDGALYLVEQGLVDPDRMAMFGWSYGGYAALVAASREDQIYQCAIAGAAVADNVLQLNYYVSRLSGSSRIQQERFWRDSISPIDEVAKVNIPLFVVHGSVDQRVPLEHAKRYLAALDENAIPYEYMELEGADHFSNTLTFDHQKMFYTRMLSYFAEDCGPGGL
ncbi:alpha/beta hydrolase family protein [Umboniibacter marinipuniceus]|uniref:Dipeptidyl aminopeptidase/acylaminoacyl peptidase n=1 Tax=Umboniibacter marinipuniceus TaxID=569599 RepID=A0A3M0A7S2_9GAMM|nr:prolyl oligopeptidase family serine peptidase [Umboniibacter marinipuniceus]RMA78858.1 dipeptidyl aminopeptidase/acylaminoacyl peptidase [Umboniibacter marinipuniceus]